MIVKYLFCSGIWTWGCDEKDWNMGILKLSISSTHILFPSSKDNLPKHVTFDSKDELEFTSFSPFPYASSPVVVSPLELACDMLPLALILN